MTVRVRGAREHNLKDVDVDLPRDSLVVFTGISGSGKSSLAFGTLFAESQRRYLESVAPYARRLLDQAGVPDVDSIEGMPPAVALQQQRGAGNARSSVGSVTTLSNLLRLLYSRAGSYPADQPMLYAEDFSPNTVEGACPRCHGIGRVYEVSEDSLVPDDSLTIRERAIAAWPPAWHGQNLRDVLVSLGYDVDTPWRKLKKKDRDWILFTEERPTVPVYAGFTPEETREALAEEMEPSYQGTFTGARRYVLDTFANTKSASMKARVQRFMTAATCPDCHGKRLKPEALSVTFAGYDIAELAHLPLARLAEELDLRRTPDLSAEKRLAAQRLVGELMERVRPILDLGLGYLSLDRSTPTLSAGELQRMRLATQLSSQLFGVVYVLDEPSASLHPRDRDALLGILAGLKARGNSVFVVEHALDVIRAADWLVDIGPDAGEHGGRVLYSGPPAGLEEVEESITRRYLFGDRAPAPREPREPAGRLALEHVSRNNLHDVTVSFPLGCLTAVTGPSGAGKSSLVSQALPALVRERMGHEAERDEEDDDASEAASLLSGEPTAIGGHVVDGVDSLRRVLSIDQRPIGRTPRSNVATYTGLFDDVRRLFAATPAARRLEYGPGRFSFNVAAGRCPTCAGEGSVMVELLFLPSVYAPCPDCHGTRYKPSTLEIAWHGRNVAEVLAMTVEEALDFFAEEARVMQSLTVLRDVGLGYLRLGQPATELSGGEAQRVKLAAELQRAHRGDALYILDEPTAGLHAADTDRLLTHLQGLVDAGNTVVVVEQDMRLVAQADWVIDLGPGAGNEGGRIVAAGPPEAVASDADSVTAPYLASALAAPARTGRRR